MKVHLIGIGGIGMSGLARYFKAAGWRVSGSDITGSEITRALTKEGIEVIIGHKKNNILPDVRLVIYNRAIEKKNPELLAARDMRVVTLPYARALGMLTERYKTIAITGSHGKSTTTALAALTLMKGGLDPTVFIGTNLRELGGRNIRIGRSPYLVLEADDYGGAILEYSPTIAIVTNIDREHLDFYRTFENLKKAFLEFLSNTKTGGTFILNKDDPTLHSLRSRIAAIAKKKRVCVVWYSLRDPVAKKVRRVLALPGIHNLSNACAVYALGKVLRVKENKTFAALGAYHGAWRRMEYKGIARMGGVSAKVYDDYAHHPTEIRATLQGFREKFPRSPIICVYQPHQAKRLDALFKEFSAAFDEADMTVLLPLYKVPGRDEVVRRNSDALARAMWKRSPKQAVFYVAQPKNLKKDLKQIVAARAAIKNRGGTPVIVMMGAGDIAVLTAKLVSFP